VGPRRIGPGNGMVPLAPPASTPAKNRVPYTPQPINQDVQPTEGVARCFTLHQTTPSPSRQDHCDEGYGRTTFATGVGGEPTMHEHSHTPVTFSREEIAQIRLMLTTPDKLPTCPRCEGNLSVEEPDVQELKGHVYLRCQACNRTAFVSREPRHRPFDLYG
jgi:hypothetical protein